VSADTDGLVETVEAAYRQYFQLIPARASVSFVGVQPIEVLRFSEPVQQEVATTALTHYLSLGMCRYPMVAGSETHTDDRLAPRAELLISVTGAADGLWRRLAVLAAAPAVEGAVYQDGGRLHLGEALVTGSRCTGGILTTAWIPAIAVPGTAGVRLLQVLPATATELAWARVHGSSALRQRWAECDTPLHDLMREPVILTAPGNA
jgi:hypothetical protein